MDAAIQAVLDSYEARYAKAYQRRVRELEFDSALLPVGSGVELSRRR